MPDDRPICLLDTNTSCESYLKKEDGDGQQYRSCGACSKGCYLLRLTHNKVMMRADWEEVYGIKVYEEDEAGLEILRSRIKEVNELTGRVQNATTNLGIQLDNLRKEVYQVLGYQDESV